MEGDVYQTWTEVEREGLRRIIDEHRTVRGPLIEVLHRTQGLLGAIPPDAQRWIADELGIPRSRVHGVVTFYSFFRTQRPGRHLIRVCAGTACHVRGAGRVLDLLSEALGVRPGETTEDGAFTLQTVRCVGACGLAPVMMIDDEVYGKLDRGRIERILERYRG